MCTENKPLMPFVVLYTEPSVFTLPEGALFQAESSEHAEEQMLNENPKANIVWVVNTDNINTAMATYERESSCNEFPDSFPHHTYRCIALSTSLLTAEDVNALDELSNDEGCAMVFSRDTGFFIKLYDEAEYNFHHSKGQGAARNYELILQSCLAAGYTMVEFDTDV